MSIAERLRQIADERERDGGRLVTARPFACRAALGMIAAGNHDAAAALIELAGLSAILALVQAGAAPAALRVAIETALLCHYRDLAAFITAHGGRAVFAAWCRQAEFIAPKGLPEIIDLYRGTLGVSPALAAEGLFWSPSFDMAAFHAARFADADLTGALVVHARVPHDAIAAYLTCTATYEVVPAVTPTEYEVITDRERISDAAVRFSKHQDALEALGWQRAGKESDIASQQAAVASRAGMAAAGVAPGTAIVA